MGVSTPPVYRADDSYGFTDEVIQVTSERALTSATNRTFLPTPDPVKQPSSDNRLRKKQLAALSEDRQNQTQESTAHPSKTKQMTSSKLIAILTKDRTNEQNNRTQNWKV